MTDHEIRRIDGGGGGDLQDAFDVRRAVFIDEQGVPEDLEMDGKDGKAVHVVVYDQGAEVPVGTARLRRLRSDVGKAERVAVRRRYRGQGLGRLLMDRIEEEARAADCGRMVVHAQTTVEGFYERLGYETVGEEFEEAGIAHVEMEKELG